MPIFSSAIRLKRFRRNFGISAPRLAIHAHTPWYWRALIAVSFILLLLVVSILAYESYRSSGFDRDEAEREILRLKKQEQDLNEELEQLRVLAKTRESEFQIKETLQQQLSEHVQQLETENTTLKQDLAFFETLMPSSMNGQEGIKVDHLKISSGDKPGEYRYRMLVVNNFGSQTKVIKGNLRLSLKVRQNGKDVMITIPAESEPIPPHFNFEIKYFYRFEGVFSIPEGSALKSVEANLMQNEVVLAKQSVNL